MKTKLFLSILLSLSFISTGQAAQLENAQGLISPAIEILKSQEEMKKGNISGSRIDFTKEDFQDVIGKEKFQGIVIHTLPENTVGTLQFEGLPVDVGQVIPAEDLNELSIIPTSQAISTGHFTFSELGGSESYSCAIYLGEEESTPPSAYVDVLNTYQNVALYFQIEITSATAVSLEIVETCENGILEKCEETGAYIYRPKTNFYGTDYFLYRAVDQYGNKTDVQKAKIRIEKEKSNLYFSDMAEKKNHNNAILVCSKGWMQYTMNQNGLPQFEPTEPVTAKEFIVAAQKAMEVKNSARFSADSEGGVLSMSEILNEQLTYREAKEIIGLLWQYTDETAKEVGLLLEEEKKLTREDCAEILAAFFKK